MAGPDEVQDPGWLPALKKVGSAFFAPPKLAKVRPAITVARARTLPGLLVIPLLTALLPFLDQSESSEAPMLALGFVIAVLCVLGVGWVRVSPRRFFRTGDLASGFLQASANLTAFGTAPVLWGYVGFFAGGGTTTFAAGALLSIALLLGPARPSEALAHAWEERLEISFPPGAIWQAALDPTR